ncbi:hypothetical protein BGZ58_009396 [Dissophora ornata]|nr:hypothetical protein BGZ58_009396 [Dissophora ornata]
MSTPHQKDSLTGSDADAEIEQLQETNVQQLEISQYQRPPSDWNYPEPYITSSHSITLAPATRAQEISYDSIPETIIYFPDPVPVLPLLTFTQFESSPGHVSLNTGGRAIDHPETEVDRTLARIKSSIGEKMTWNAIGFADEGARSCFHQGPGKEPTQYRQWSKDSSETLTNDHATTSRQRGCYKIMSCGDLIAAPDATSANCKASTTNIHLSVPQPIYGASSAKAADTAGDGGPKKPSDLLLLHKLSPVSPSTVTLPAGKRYFNPKQKKRARKTATKTAKVFFSNERTFIHWIKFGVLLGSLAMTLLNFSGEDVRRKVDQSLANRAERIGRIVGAGLMVICLLCLAYASSIFHWRHLGVARSKSDGRYFDRIGPTLLTLALLITYSVNILLTVQITSNMDANYQPSVFYNFHPDNISAPMTPPPVSQPPTFDTPSLPPVFPFLVDDDGNVDEDDMEPAYASSLSPSPLTVPIQKIDASSSSTPKSKDTPSSDTME